jgi:hypothetical protein
MAFEDLRIEMKCKDFRSEIEEGSRGDSLSIAAQDHGAVCRPCHEFNQKHVELREWMAVCRKVTAPKDFQFGVQRRIANAGAGHAHGWAWNRLRYIVPTAALAAVAALSWSYISTLPSQQTGNPQTFAAMTNSNVTPNQTAPPAVITEAPVVSPDQQLASGSNKQENNARINAPKESATEKGGGSLTQGAGNVAESKKPSGIEVRSGGDPAKLGLRNTLQALQQLGVITNLEKKVIKVTGSAVGSGIELDDVVESLNGNVLTVRRGNQTIQITIK